MGEEFQRSRKMDTVKITRAATSFIGIGIISILQAQAQKSVWDGVYSPTQATRGAAVYANLCATCHGDELEGAGQNPGLNGDDFRKEWNGQYVADLFDRIQASMPADKPGSLTRTENAGIVAFMLRTNGYPAGSADLKDDPASLKSIQMLQKR